MPGGTTAKLLPGSAFSRFQFAGAMMSNAKIFKVVVFSFFFPGLLAWPCMQRQTVPLPDDDPVNHKVAAPEQTERPAPATASPAGSGAAAPDEWNQSATISGVKVDFRGVASLKDVVIKHGPLPVSLNQITSSELVEGQQGILQFRFTDAAGNPMRGLRVGSWMDEAQDQKPADKDTCHRKIQSFLQMNLSARPEVDLNTYYLLALTEDPSILIIDPRVGFSSSKLYGVIDLAAPGADWVQSRSGDRIFVSMPAANQVAAIDSMSFRLIMNVNAGASPGRLLIQPDGRKLWVTTDGAGAGNESGVTAIDTTTLEVLARIPTGRGHHEIAFDDDEHVYVSNQDDGTVSILSTADLTKVKDVPVGRMPIAIAYSSRSRSVFVANAADGRITQISAEDLNAKTPLAARPGLSALLITSDGRWGFVANRKDNEVLLFDVSSGRFVQHYPVGPSPDQLAATDSYVYVRSGENEHVRLISLATPGTDSNTAEFPAGQQAPGSGVLASAFAPGLEGNSAFISNPGDRRIYFYQEGMAAPMFSMEGYGKTPTAVMLVDRSIRETSPGVYSVGVRLPKPGVYDVPVYIDSPSISYCYQFTVKPNPLLKKQPLRPVVLHALNNNLQITMGETAQMQFRLVDPETNKPKQGLKDVEVTVLLAEGLRQMHLPAEMKGNEGVYEVSFTPSKDGVYYGMVTIPSLGIRPNQLPYLMVRAVAGRSFATKPAQVVTHESKMD